MTDAESLFPRLSSRLYVLRRDNRVLYLEPEYPDWITINCRYEGIFDRFDGKHSLGDVFRFIGEHHRDESSLLVGQIDSLVKTSKIFAQDYVPNADSRHQRESRLRYVYLTLTDACNLSCKYCYAKARNKECTLPLETWCTFVDRLVAFSSPLTFVFTGGEPLVVPYVFELANHISTRGSGCILMTNGTMIESGETAARIAGSFELTKVSLDSLSPDTSSRLRGEGTLERVLVAVGLLDEAMAEYTLLATVNSLNKEDLESLSERFDNRVAFQPLYQMGAAKSESALAISGDEYYDALARTGSFRYLSSYHRNIHSYRGNPSKRCAMAQEELSIGPHGDLFPCHMLHYPELRVGSMLTTESVETLYDDSGVLRRLRDLTVDSIPQCKDCIVRNFCGAGCRARLDFYRDGLDGNDSFCNFEKRLIADALLYSYG